MPPQDESVAYDRTGRVVVEGSSLSFSSDGQGYLLRYDPSFDPPVRFGDAPYIPFDYAGARGLEPGDARVDVGEGRSWVATQRGKLYRIDGEERLDFTPFLTAAQIGEFKMGPALDNAVLLSTRGGVFRLEWDGAARRLPWRLPLFKVQRGHRDGWADTSLWEGEDGVWVSHRSRLILVDADGTPRIVHADGTLSRYGPAARPQLLLLQDRLYYVAPGGIVGEFGGEAERLGSVESLFASSSGLLLAGSDDGVWSLLDSGWSLTHSLHVEDQFGVWPSRVIDFAECADGSLWALAEGGLWSIPPGAPAVRVGDGPANVGAVVCEGQVLSWHSPTWVSADVRADELGEPLPVEKPSGLVMEGSSGEVFFSDSVDGLAVPSAGWRSTWRRCARRLPIPEEGRPLGDYGASGRLWYTCMNRVVSEPRHACGTIELSGVDGGFTPVPLDLLVDHTELWVATDAGVARVGSDCDYETWSWSELSGLERTAGMTLRMPW